MNDRGSEGIRLFPVHGIPEITPGDDLARMIATTTTLVDRDVVVVTQKVVSKAEGRLVEVNPATGHKPLVEAESVRILRRRGDLIISETAHGFVCANAGVDLSNVADGTAALLPVAPDRSAHGIRNALKHYCGVDVAVVVSDTFGRPWRRGVTDVAIGCSGLRPIIDLRGSNDALGRELQVTEVAVVDELAAAAELVMGKAAGVPVAIIRGVDPSWFGEGGVVADVVRESSEDLFR
ncbi:MAG: coenzyme F420-0:L-glutamate ligase [Actinomycetota bacterium]|nr:coenzyme F420-0:L-glutamate ligase [Actinomycetota bacterium]